MENIQYVSKDLIDGTIKEIMVSFINSISLSRKDLGNQYTVTEILSTLGKMEVLEIEGKGYIPTYTRTKLTDALHEAFGFRTGYQLIPPKTTKNICSQTKK